MATTSKTRQVSRYVRPTERICRNEIKNAPYNPRKISESAAKKLRKNIMEVGLLGGIVVNRRSMNIVSGHQRLAALDALERCDDYLLDVVMVDMTDAEEKRQNAFMNNLSAQGDWDAALLRDLVAEVGWEECGFDPQDMAILDIETGSFELEKRGVSKDVGGEKTTAAKKRRKENLEEAAEENDINHSLTIVFPDSATKERYLAFLDMRPMTCFVKAEVFEGICRNVYTQKGKKTGTEK